MRITKKCEVWLEQFRTTEDRQLAVKLLRKIRLVTHKDLSDWYEQIFASDVFEDSTAIFIERELQQTASPLPPPMYKESLKRPLRIEGAAAQAIQSLSYAPQTIGSEGKIATIIDQICASSPSRLFLQPATSILRKRNVRNLVVVTDLVGSGKRVSRMLDSLWRLQSIKSWKSYRLINFHVVCYSITEAAEKILINHPARPNIVKKILCPTVRHSFKGSEFAELESLCERHGKFSKNPLGFKRSGTLIAFEDKVPNNMPAILIEASKSTSFPWMPLFPKRLSQSIVNTDRSVASVEFGILKLLGLEDILSAPAYNSLGADSRLAVIYVAASSSGYTEISDFACLSDMSIDQIIKARKIARQKGLMSTDKKVSSRGKQTIRKFVDGGIAAIGKPQEIMYYPKQLRAPI